MSGFAIVWMVVFGLSGAMFFAVAVFVGVQGWKDLQDLLHPEREP